MDPAKNLESSLNILNGRHININEDRSKYTAHYNALRDSLYSTIKDKNLILKKLLKGHKLEGSYGDNLKVATPDEFDLVINLAFPENDYIIVKADPQRPGNVTLDMTEVMERIRNQEQNREIYEQLQKIVNAKNMLLENKLQSWLQGLFTKTLNDLNNRIDVNGHISQLVYKRAGPAHTIYIKEPQEYSVDFVPSIRLSAKQIVLGPKQKEYFGKSEYWNAIPKPIKGQLGDNISYRASYYDAEHNLLKHKANLKNGIRFMKQFRDTKQNMGNLKSYYIKTLFLWQVIEREPGYWQKQLNEILIDMFHKLADCLKTDKRNGKLLFFWDPKLDMFADFTESQRKDMFNCAVGCGAYFLKMASGNMNDNNIENVLSSFCKLVDKTNSKQTEKPGQTNVANPTSLAPSKTAGQNGQNNAKTNQPEASVKPSEAETKTATGKKPKICATKQEPKAKTTPSPPSKPVGQNDQTKAKSNQPNQTAAVKTDTRTKPKKAPNAQEPKANPAPSTKPAEKNGETKSKTKQTAAPVTKTEPETKSQTLPQPSKSVSEQKNTQAKPQTAKDEKQRNESSCKLS